MKWTVKSTHVVYKNRWMWVTEDVLVNDEGQEVAYGVVHKKPFALIIPWENGRVILVRQYRYPVDFDSWEFPEGHLEEAHVSIDDAARKELEEEAGLQAKVMRKIGSFFLAAGHHTQECIVFVASGLRPGKPQRELVEVGMLVGTFTLAEVTNMVRQGKIKDSPTISALKLFEIYLADNGKAAKDR